MRNCFDKVKKTGRLSVQILSWNVRGFCDFQKSDSKIRQFNDFVEKYFEWDFFFI